MDEVLALLRRMSAGVWRRRWLAVGVSWLVCIAGWVVVLALPARYEASTQIYVAADPVLKPLLNGIAINGTSDAEFALLRQTLLSRPNLTALIQKTGLDNQAQGPGAQEALIRSLADRIQIIPQTDQLFTISYQSKNPKKAFTIVQNLEDIYVERSADRNQSDIDNATVFLDSQIAYFKQQLQQVEQTRAAFQAKYLQLLPGANGVSELGTEAALVTNLQGQLQDALAQKQMIQAALAKTSPVLTAAQGGAVLDPQLAAAEQHLADLKRQYTDAYPGAIDAQKQVDALKAEGSAGSHAGATVQRSLPNDVYDKLKLDEIQADTNIYSLQRQIKTATAERDRLAELARSQPGLQAQYTNLDRNYGVLLQEYHDLLGRREAMRIGAAANITANQVQLQIVNPPQLPRVPIAPPRILLMSAVLFLGIGAGLAAAVLRAEIDGCFYSIDDLRGIGLPVIGGITQLRRAGRQIQPFLQVGAAFALLVVVYGGFLAATILLQRLT
ncbi:MAG: hypothetical protein B7X01_00800 [Acidiphilium sp. 21-62-4]|nr:MAG: hypothetical protein B7X01_00800 [Acidiphilium sp. 21-62-4]